MRHSASALPGGWKPDEGLCVQNPDEINASEDSAFCRRVARYLDGDLDPTEYKQLTAELFAERAKRVAFVQMCTVRAALIRDGAANRVAGEIHGRAGAATGLGQESAGANLSDSVQPMDETMILPAIRDDDLGIAADTLPEQFTIAPTGQDSGRQFRRRRDRRRWWLWGSSAALLMLAFGLVWTLRPGRQPVANRHNSVPTSPSQLEVIAPPAVVTAVAGTDLFQPGEELENGQSLDLNTGAVELKFDSGATVLLRGPARARISSRNGLSLEAGSLYAHVPPEAIGFGVSAPGLRLLDRGTNFGVRTASAGAAAEVHVFEGLVDATALNAQGISVGTPTPVRTGQAVGHSATAPGPGLQAIPFAATTFDRDIAQIRIPVPTHGTGEGIAPGSPDPRWQIVSVSGDPSWTPRPASVIVDPRNEYAPNSKDANWLSTTPHMESAAAANFTYRTTVDLTGFDPTSVIAKATMAADDGVFDVLVNGKSAHLAEAIRNLSAGDWRTASHEVALENLPWVAGPNQVDVIVLNAPPVGGGPNYTGLQFGWTITASMAVRR
jgi:hypothetical protein